MVRFLLFLTLLSVVAIYAWRRGGWPEKAAATGLVLQVAVDQAYHLLSGTRGGDFTDVHLWHFFLDLALFGFVIYIALRADRFWPLWLGGTMIIMLIAHPKKQMIKLVEVVENAGQYNLREIIKDTVKTDWKNIFELIPRSVTKSKKYLEGNSNFSYTERNQKVPFPSDERGGGQLFVKN